MLKASLLAGIMSAMALGLTATAGELKNAKLPEQDANIIVEVDRSLESLTEEGISNYQNTVMNNIRKNVTSNFKVVSKYSVVANAFALSVNSNDIEAIKKVPGVKSITLDEIHWVRSVSEPLADEEFDPDEIDIDYGGEDNASAKTMNKPDDTYEGEGTAIAILDNEFYFKAKSSKNATDGWNHETFSALDSENVAVRFDGRPSAYNKTHAYAYDKDKVGSTQIGIEGSLYFNNKVPFYFDYGGDTNTRSIRYAEDFDVSSTTAYHGSHVASIAAGNAPTYKGIAPKAQLICMKVFTNFSPKPGSVEAALGYSASSGAYDIPILNALEDCITLGVDGINMSLGSDLDDFDQGSITQKTLSKLADSGKILTSISAGNAGKASYSSVGSYANWTKDMVETGILGSYANNAKAQIIAAGQPELIFYKSAFEITNDDSSKTNIAFEDQIVNREGFPKDYNKEYKMKNLVKDDPTKPLEWVYVPGFGSDNDYKDLEVRGKVAFVNRGSTTFADKYQTAKRKGAIAIVIINNDPTSNDFNFRCSFGDDFKPSMPCALILFKDKAFFEAKRTGQLKLLSNQTGTNPNAYTISTFSSDGARFDLDLKPDITAPGENIRGAVPPQTKADKQFRQYKSYEFLSGTSMSSPNHAGAQSVILSKVAGKIYHDAYMAGKSVKSSQLKEINSFRTTVDMRLMSTAHPMYDVEVSPESGEKVLTSPRRQGAGMVDINAAYNTDVYFEQYELDADNNPVGTGKAKVTLRNNEDINKGDIKLSFLAHNESESAKTYTVKLSVLRPAVVMANDIVTKDYNYIGEVETISTLPGMEYWIDTALHEGDPIRPEKRIAEGTFNNRDVYKVSRQIRYFPTEEALRNNEPSFIEIGNYYNAGDSEHANWVELPKSEYLSVQDVLIDEVNLTDVVINPGTSVINLDQYSLSSEAKAKINASFDYGCYIEGYATLVEKDVAEPIVLSIPYLGYYGGEDGNYESAPIVEPFAFEKDIATVYPSDLANDIAKQFVGKDRANMGSLWVTGYVPQGDSIPTERVLSNDDNFANLSGFKQLGTDDNGKFVANAKDNLYAGSPYASNTMIIQQFVLRSVADNYFTITNKADNKVYYKSALEDMLFGDSMGQYQLYKSHVDGSYLSAGYVSHRAYAIVPLYDEKTGDSFPSGEYEVTFNYLLAGTNSWVSKSYTLHIDSDLPEIQSIVPNGDNVRINIKENNLAYASVGKYTNEFKKDNNGYYLELTKNEITQHVNENMNAVIGSGRLFLKVSDAAYGSNGVLVRFARNSDGSIIFNEYEYTMVQNYQLTYAHDFDETENGLKIYKYDSAKATQEEVELDGLVLLSHGPVVDEDTDIDVTIETIVNKKCGGNIMTTSIILSSVAGLSFCLLLISKKKRRKGGSL